MQAPYELRACFKIDSPEPSSLQYRHGFSVKGWAYSPDWNPSDIVVSVDDYVIGASSIFFTRPDVARSTGIPEAGTGGFHVMCALPRAWSNGRETATVVSRLLENGRELAKDERKIELVEREYRAEPFGLLLEHENKRILHRDDIYRGGPPSPVASAEAVELLLNYLAEGEIVLDVGCGIGAFAEAMIAAGITWIGCEVDPEFCAVLAARGLAYRARVEDSFPFERDEVSSAIAIEVLEHVMDADLFVAEMARVAKRAAYFSVPNMETLPIFSTYYALPWHMLLRDHKNFFNRFSLQALLRRHFARVEVFEYGRIPVLDSKEGLPIHNHLFAVALH
jgi:SAM-dependent methyltransferase